MFFGASVPISTATAFTEERTTTELPANSSVNSLKYGDLYHIQNGFQDWSRGYLDTRGAGCQSNLLCVSLSSGTDRDNGSGTWQILPADTSKKLGDPVLQNDLVYFQNQYVRYNQKGFLDTRGVGCQDNLLCVSVASGSNRDNGSGTWRIITDSSGGEVKEGELVRLLNGFNNFQGGFLDTRGLGCQDNILCVSTSVSWNRDTGSTTWRFQR